MTETQIECKEIFLKSCSKKLGLERIRRDLCHMIESEGLSSVDKLTEEDKKRFINYMIEADVEEHFDLYKKDIEEIFGELLEKRFNSEENRHGKG